MNTKEFSKYLVDVVAGVMSEHGLLDYVDEYETQAFCEDLCNTIFQELINNKP